MARNGDDGWEDDSWLSKTIAPRNIHNGAQLIREMKHFLNFEGERIDVQLKRIFKASLDDLPLGASTLAQLPNYWERLVDACTTVGSRSLDVIEKRLRIIGNSLNWSEGTDYRTLAHQLYLATEQARKMKNVYRQRRKCVQAVLKNLEVNKEKDVFYTRMQGPIAPDIQSWAYQAFDLFRSKTEVNKRFHDMYEQEWREFVSDYLTTSDLPPKYDDIFRRQFSDYEKELEKQLIRGPYSFFSQKSTGLSSTPRNDFDLSENLALNLKLSAGELIMIYEFQNPTEVDIMSLSTEIFFELMNKYHIEFLGVNPINTGNKGIRIELPKPDKPDVLQSIQSTVIEIFSKH